MRVRDNQKARVYRAERELTEWVPDARYQPDPRIDTQAKMQAYVNRLITYRWFEKEFGGNWKIRVGDGRRCRNALGHHTGPRRGWIKMPRWSRSELVLLHEVAHAMTDDRHGPNYVACYILLVEKKMGSDVADRLRAACRKHNIDWSWTRRAA